jgi:hypothetical protein
MVKEQNFLGNQTMDGHVAMGWGLYRKQVERGRRRTTNVSHSLFLIN